MYIFRPHYSPYWPANYNLLEVENYQNLPLQKIAMLEDFPKEAAPWILLTNSHFQKKFVPDMWWKKIQLVIHSNSGFDALEVVKDKLINIPVVLGNELRSNAVVEYYLQCLLQAWGPIPLAHKSWDPKRQFPRTLIDKKNIILLGYGHVGKLLCSVLELLGARVTISDPLYPAVSTGEINWKGADAVLLCCSLTDSSLQIINKNILEKLNESIVLINGSRGKIINETDLLALLPNRPKWKIYLDVFENEPAAFEYWKKFSNVNCTSHIAGVYNELSQNSLDFEHNTLKDFFHLSTIPFLEKYRPKLWHP
jgi:phosphoglycerate dehydrogenase-like enzyme